MTTELITSRGPIENSKDVLVKDLKLVVGDADALLKEMADSTAEEFSAARNRVVATLADARSKLLEAQRSVSGKARCAADASLQYVAGNPWKAIGVAAGAGLVIGLLLSRSLPPPSA